MRRAYAIFALTGLAVAAPLIAAMANAQSKSLRSSEAVAHAPEFPSPSSGPSIPSLPSPRLDCPDGMVLVEGAWCPRVEQRCLHWMDPPGKYHRYRCAEYARPASCLAPRVHKRFCVDRRERTDLPTGLPLNVQSWTDAKRACEDAGARVCMDSEWTFACEGEEMRPYPYGWSRTQRDCNADRTDLLTPGQPRRLRDEREPAHASCASPFGVLDMAGNVAEWVSVDGYPQGSAVVQKGNWWQPGKHACRDEQAGHDRFYKGTETGFRCCATAR